MATANLTTVSILSAVVDKLGALKAKIDTLEKEAEGYKDQLKSSGESVIEGKLFRATISRTEREIFSAKLAKGFLSAAEIVECTSFAEAVTVRVGSR